MWKRLRYLKIDPYKSSLWLGAIFYIKMGKLNQFTFIEVTKDCKHLKPDKA